MKATVIITLLLVAASALDLESNLLDEIAKKFEEKLHSENNKLATKFQAENKKLEAKFQAENTKLAAKFQAEDKKIRNENKKILDAYKKVDTELQEMKRHCAASQLNIHQFENSGMFFFINIAYPK